MISHTSLNDYIHLDVYISGVVASSTTTTTTRARKPSSLALVLGSKITTPKIWVGAHSPKIPTVIHVHITVIIKLSELLH